MFVYLVFAVLLITMATALSPVEIKGYKFFELETNEELVVRGIDYYPRPNKGDLNQNSLDLFTVKHRHIWERDIPYLQELGVNAIRLYAVDPDEDHDAFMCSLNAAGIYVIVALAHDCPTCAVTKDEAPDCYPTDLKLQGQKVINAFAKYPNTLAFSAGNEVNHVAPPNQPEWNGPCQKKFLRDMRKYIDSCNHLRNVPIGLISADNDRKATAAYYNCQSNPNDEYENAEWYGLNSYVFCNGQAEKYTDASGFKLLEQSFMSLNYSIPTLLTEYGCLSESFPTMNGYAAQRDFRQAQWMMQEKSLREQFSGGFAFEYSIEMENAKSESPWPFTTFGEQNYGIGYFGPENCDDVTVPCNYHPFPSFDQLRKAYQVSDDDMMIKTVDKDNFQVPSSRKGRNVCPKQFPALASFKWKADATSSIKCPNAGDESSFVCPADLTKLFQPNRSKKGPSSRGSSILSTTIGVVAVVIGMIAVALLTYLLVQQRRHGIPAWLTIKKQTDEDGDSNSDESAGLLSMKSYHYQAIDSDSSSEDLEGLTSARRY